MSWIPDPRAAWSVAENAVRSIGGAFVAGLTGSETAAGAPAPRPATVVPRPAPAQAAERRDPALGAKMDRLLSRALEQSTASGTEELFHRVLDQLVPDEARIISALSDGSASPMVSVHALTRAGLLGEPLIEHAALVGRTANVALPRLTPTYVGHLLSLGLLEPGPEDDGLKDEYQILMADNDVLRAIRKGSRGPVPARVERRTVRLSPLGLALWAAVTGDPA